MVLCWKKAFYGFDSIDETMVVLESIVLVSFVIFSVSVSESAEWQLDKEWDSII